MAEQNLTSKTSTPTGLGIGFSMLCLIFSITIGINMNHNVQLKNDVKLEYVELNHIKYGFFSTFEWKKALSKIVKNKVKTGKLSQEAKDNLRMLIINELHRMLQKVNALIEREANGFENFFLSLTGLTNIINERVRNKIPEFADAIVTNFIDNQENRDRLNDMVQGKLKEVFQDENRENIDFILRKYNSSNLENCRDFLAQRLSELDNLIWKQTIYIIISSLIIVITYFVNKSNINIYYHIILIASIIWLLLNGLYNPVMTIEIKLSKISIDILGENINFNNQIIFFQSKSIVQVFTSLINSSNFTNIFVGLLVLLFSILFPLLKILLSILSLNSNKFSQNKYFNYIIFKSAKWSMADVMLVSIFMAYIGLSNLISSQISYLNRYLNVINSDSTVLEVGFLFFTFFCVTNIILSTIIEQISKSKELDSVS